MIPSLINECSLPYRERIARLEDRRSAFRNTADWLLERSRAHESLARFFLRVGRPREAYQEYENAAESDIVARLFKMYQEIACR